MTIRIQWKERVFEINIGRKTKWFTQLYLISIVEICYGENGIVQHANMLYKAIEGRK